MAGFSTEDTEPFSGPDSDEPRDPFPAVKPANLGDTSDMDFAAVAPDHLPIAKGSDTYAGLPGDGIVPGY